jgi:uncharacterized protein (DUF849 family)
MTDDNERSEVYRNRAEELRAVAETMKSKETRQTLQQLAADYEKMAQRLKPS